jgi:Methylase involved in ubiquinone/menaquinone biosynthesis
MNVREYFNSVAFEWDDISSHDEIKIKKIIEISQVPENSKIVDVGTGTGILINYLLVTYPAKITAVDISENMISMAKSKYHDGRVEFAAVDIADYTGDEYDYAFLYSAYPHFQDRNGLFMHIAKLLKAGGKIVIAHSEGREKINDRHKANENTSNDILPPAVQTAELMSKYFAVEKIIDNDEMYYISGIKK